jgi:hypothetical protein
LLYLPIVEFGLVNVATMTWLFKVFVSSLNLLQKQIVLANIIERHHGISVKNRDDSRRITVAMAKSMG